MGHAAQTRAVPVDLARLGVEGAFLCRLLFQRLGRARQFVCRFCWRCDLRLLLGRHRCRCCFGGCFGWGRSDCAFSSLLLDQGVDCGKVGVGKGGGCGTCESCVDIMSACRPASFVPGKPTRFLVGKDGARVVKVDGARRQTPPKPSPLPCALLGRSCREEPAGAGADGRPDGAKRAGRGPQRGAVHCDVDCGGQASGRFETRAVSTEEKANGAKRASRSGLVGEFVSQKGQPKGVAGQILEMPSPKRSIAGSSRALLIGKEGKRPTFILQLTSTPTSISTRQHQSFK